MDQPKTFGYVTSAIPGRVRIRIDPGHRVLMPQVREQLASLPGISGVEARPTTGSVVVEYDRARMSHADVLKMLHAIGMPIRDRAATEAVAEGKPRERIASGVTGAADPFQEDRGMVTQAGPLVVDWPRSVGYFGAVTLAVALELIPLPLGAFIAVVPFLKLVKRPDSSHGTRFVVAVFEGAAIPVGGQSESVIRLARKESASS